MLVGQGPQLFGTPPQISTLEYRLGRTPREEGPPPGGTQDHPQGIRDHPVANHWLS